MRGSAVYVVSLLIWGVAQAQESGIKLTTLPERERVEIQLAHGESTLVEEERTLNLLKGTNEIQFSWDNVNIDGGSILFRALDDAAGVTVLNVNYPPGRQALTWQVHSKAGGPARIRISYLLANVGRSYSYRAVVSRDEKTMVLRKYLTLRNVSGEGFQDAAIWAGFGKSFKKFILTGESKMMLLHRFDDVPVRKTYTYDPAATGDKVWMHYVLKNDTANKLGLFPLQFGKVRLFMQDSQGGDAFLGEDWGAFTPIDAEMRLAIGLSKDIVVKRKLVRNERLNVRWQVHDQEMIYEYEIENFKKEAVRLDIVEHVQSQGEKGPETSEPVTLELRDAFTPVLHVDCPPEGKKVVVRFHFIQKNLW